MCDKSTFFKLDRKIFDSDIWLQPLELRLFIYLIGQARYEKEPNTKYKNKGVIIKRGQFLRSYRKLQEDLEFIENNAVKTYSLSRLKTAVDRLVKQERITIENTALGTLFTICNYLQYQGEYKNNKGTKNRPRTDPEQTQNNTVRKVIKIIKIIILSQKMKLKKSILNYQTT